MRGPTDFLLVALAIILSVFGWIVRRDVDVLRRDIDVVKKVPASRADSSAGRPASWIVFIEIERDGAREVESLAMQADQFAVERRVLSRSAGGTVARLPNVLADEAFDHQGKMARGVAAWKDEAGTCVCGT